MHDECSKIRPKVVNTTHRLFMPAADFVHCCRIRRGAHRRTTVAIRAKLEHFGQHTSVTVSAVGGVEIDPECPFRFSPPSACKDWWPHRKNDQRRRHCPPVCWPASCTECRSLGTLQTRRPAESPNRRFPRVLVPVKPK